MSDNGAALIWCPFPDVESAKAAAQVLLEERLVACANIAPAMTSVFRYKDKVQSATEAGALFKTTGALLDAAIERLAALHPYDTPAISGWHADSAPQTTVGWLHDETVGGD
ncbi:divalent-cation tolerance protein CutA [Aurantiacibacter gangjinensis]|uniref:divalent-cation tolerance protein CutA n=1 Tax=Aurantiacibacter gangjinensis TaxID=502682 RepID=UPI00090C5121|nr:divalent-cation tolerance protein CutA [Aurantiacibacter gangjinensis]APE27483.1 Periplasmic divalent cation tolerance protein CutA [Aurantiacibacter gangjinensis]